MSERITHQRCSNLLSHPSDPVLQFLVCRVGSPGKLECLLSLLLAHLSQLSTELVILFIPRIEDSKTLAHHLNYDRERGYNVRE